MEFNAFMNSLVKELVEKRGNKEETAKATLRILSIVNSGATPGVDAKPKPTPFRSLMFLKKPERVNDVLKLYAESTQKHIVGCIVAVLFLYKDKPSYTKHYEHYHALLGERRGEENKFLATHQKTEKQEDNWLTWDAVKEHSKELYDKIGAFINAKSFRSNSQWDTLQSWFVLGLFTDIAPRRNKDYQEMYIVRKWNKDMPADKNYLDLNSKTFIFNTYKTAGKYGTQTIEIPADLQAKANVYFKFHPSWTAETKRKNTPVPLLVNAEGERLTAANTITRILNKIFKKNVGASMLRHIHNSHKYADTTKSLEGTAHNMAHSVPMALNYVKYDKPTEETVVNQMTLQPPSAPV